MTPKFRAWDKEKNKMFEPTYRAYAGELEDLLISLKGDLILRKIDETIHESLFPDRFILMHSIGRTGMNENDDEKNIYTGDVISVIEQGHQMGFYVENEYVGVVEYDKGHCTYYLNLVETKYHDELPDEIDGIPIFRDDDEPERYYFNDDDSLVPEDIQILGNIYENPELIEYET